MQNENNKPSLVLKKKYRLEMEAEGLTMYEFLEKKRREREERKRKEMEDDGKIQQVIKSVSLPKNIQNLGFEKRFFTLEDAEFLLQQIDGIDDDLWEPIPMSAEMRDEEIQTLLHAGICYDFRNIGVTIYITWQFIQGFVEDGDSDIEYGYIGYYYNHFTGDFREINDEETFKITNY